MNQPLHVTGLMPRVLLPEWKLLLALADGCQWVNIITGMTVIASVNTEQDGRRWLHVSCALPDRLPTWSELRDVKDQFVGRERTAMQVIPPHSKHVNIHPNCLHLWCCPDEDILPDFTQGTGSI